MLSKLILFPFILLFFKGSYSGELLLCQSGVKPFEGPTCNFAIPELNKARQLLGLKPIKKNCDFLVGTPHCCSDFCAPAAEGGICDWENPLMSSNFHTGSCFCKGVGTPTVCSQFNERMPDFKPFTQEDFDACSATCVFNAPCTTSSIVFDGINQLCLCYCPNN